jgi:hypothetical protein
LHKHDLIYQRIKLESQAEYISSEAQRAMKMDDVPMYKALHQLHLSLMACLAEVAEAIDILEQREELK